MYQNAGEKGCRHLNPLDPPRRRANKVKGHGTWATDRLPILGVVGRTSGQLALWVCARSDRATLEPHVVAVTQPGTTANTDEWSPYTHLPEVGRAHKTVCHTPGRREWARDDDGDGLREVHCNTSEGIWTGLRNFLRPFRGVSKRYLDQYCAMFCWSYNHTWVRASLLQVMGGCFTSVPT